MSNLFVEGALKSWAKSLRQLAVRSHRPCKAGRSSSLSGPHRRLRAGGSPCHWLGWKTIEQVFERLTGRCGANTFSQTAVIPG